MAYGLEFLGWSQWFVWTAEILQMEHERREWERRKADNDAKDKKNRTLGGGGTSTVKSGGFRNE